MPTNQFGQPIGAPVEGWTARPKPPRTPMDGRLVRLEPLDADRHAADLFAAYAAAPDGRDWTYMSVERFDDVTVYTRFVATQAESDDPRHHAIVSHDTGRAVGTAALMRIDPANGVIEVGHILLSPELQQTPAATEAIYLLGRRVFDELGYRRFEWKCDRLNERSCRAAERLGFVFEGVFRQAVVTKGRNRDTAWYAIIDGDWPQVRTALLSWLGAENFDASGRQVRRLEAFHQR